MQERERKLVYIILLTVIFMMLGCSTKHKKYKGEIIFTGWTTKLEKLTLSSENTELLYTNRQNIIRSITVRDSTQIIFCTQNLSGNDQLWNLNLNDKRVAFLREGLSPCYINKYNMLFYYTYDSFKKIVSLNMLSFQALEDTHRIVQWPEGDLHMDWNFYSAVVPIGDEKVVYYGPGSCLWIYNFIRNENKKTNLTEKYPLAYRFFTNELICKDTKSNNYYFYNLVTKTIKGIDFLEGVQGVIYAEEYDAIIYSIPRMFSLAEREDIYIYEFSSKEKQKIGYNSWVRSGIYLSKSR